VGLPGFDFRRTAYNTSWWIECVMSPVVIKHWNALLAQFLKRLECKNAPTIAVILSKIVFSIPKDTWFSIK